MLAVWNQQKRIIRSRDQIFPLIKYKPFHGTNFTNNLDNTNKKFQVGKSWYIDMLRRKSNSDLEKLWYSLLREKLAIQSDKYSLTQKNLRIRDEVRTAYSKICVSMSRIKTVFGEREKINNEFNMLLEYWYIRNKQMSNNKFEVTKNISEWAKTKNKLYVRTQLEDPKNKITLMKEIKLLDREKDLQLKKTQEAVIQEKKKEINHLKEQIQERVLAKFIEDQEKLSKLKKKESAKISDEIKNVKEKIKEAKMKRAENKDNEQTKKETSKSIKDLSNKLDRLRKKKQIESAKAEKEKLSAASFKTYKTIAHETSTSESPKETENTETQTADAKKKRSGAENTDSSEVINFKKNPNSKKQSSEIQKQKVKKDKKDAAAGASAHNAEEIEEKESFEETDQTAAAIEPEAPEKMNIETYKKTLSKKKKKELEEKIKKTLRGNITRLGLKYRAILAEHKKKTLNKVLPYRRRLYDEMKNLDDITKVGYEYNVPKPTITEPIKIDTTKPIYQDILLGKVKAPVPYMKKKDNNNKKYVKVLSNKEISHAKSLIQRKNRRQVLTQFVKNPEMLSKSGRTNAYNKIQKIRSKQAQNIFLKELSALKHHLKQPNSFYQKFQKPKEETKKN